MTNNRVPNHNADVAAGCPCCGDFPAHLNAQCHPSAPLRVEAVGPSTIELRCYVPTCNRLVVRLELAGPLQ